MKEKVLFKESNFKLGVILSIVISVVHLFVQLFVVGNWVVHEIVWFILNTLKIEYNNWNTFQVPFYTTYVVVYIAMFLLIAGLAFAVFYVKSYRLVANDVEIFGNTGYRKFRIEYKDIVGVEKIAQKELRIKTKNIEETIRPKDIDKLSKVLATYNFVEISSEEINNCEPAKTNTDVVVDDIKLF